MLSHLFLACGRDGGLGALSSVPALLTSLPKAGQAGRETEWIIYGLSKKKGRL